jgi:O-antigen ligase
MKIFTAAALWLIVAFSILTMWIPDSWQLSTAEIGVFAVTAVLLTACVAGWGKVTLSPLLVPLAAIVLWGLLQLGMGESVYAWRTKVAVLYWAANASVFFCALQAFADSGIRRRLVEALVFFGFAIAVVSAVQQLDAAHRVFWLFEPPPNLIPQFGPFPYQNQYAAFVELLLPVAIFRAMTEQRRGLFHGLVVAVLYASVIAAGSRMGFFLATAELAGVPAIALWRGRVSFNRLRGPALAFAGMVAMLAAAAGPGVLVKKFETKDPYAGRREFSEASLQMVKDRPLLGFGLGTWSTVYPGYAKSDDGLFANQAHNDWGQWAAEGGLPFAALLLSVAVWATRRAWRSIEYLGVTAVFIHCLVDYPIQRIGVALVMFILLAALEESK